MSANICKASTQKAGLCFLAASHLITNTAFLCQHCSNSGLLARMLPSLWPGCVKPSLHGHNFHWWSINLKVLWRTACLNLGDCQLCKRCVVSSGIVACILGTDFRIQEAESASPVWPSSAYSNMEGLQEERGAKNKSFCATQLQSPSLATTTSSYTNFALCLWGLQYLLSIRWAGRDRAVPKKVSRWASFHTCSGGQFLIHRVAVPLQWIAMIRAWTIPFVFPGSEWTESPKCLGSLSASVCLSLSLHRNACHQTHINGSQCAAESGL